MIEYKSMTDQAIELSPKIIRDYLVSGDKSKVSDQEIQMFLELCKYQRLNPFLREVYLIKYGNSPATMVTGKETFLKRAVKNPRYEGHQTGILDNGQVAWAEVYVHNYQVPIKCEVDYDEYVGLRQDGSPNRMWTTKPRTMLKKVALVQALREAFPEDFGGLYSQEEINTVAEELPHSEVIVESGNGKKLPLKQPQKSTGRGRTSTSEDDQGKKGALPWKDRIKAFTKSIQDYEEKLGIDIYADILTKNEVDPDQIKDLTEEKGVLLYQEMEKAYQLVKNEE